jgi:hypothetical protein
LYVALSAFACQEEVIDQAKDRAFISIHRKKRMKRQAQALLIHTQSRRVLDYKHMPASDPGTGPSRGRRHHLGDCDFGVVQKPRDPHFSGTVAAKLPDAHALAAIGDKLLVQERPPFSRRSSPNRPSVSSMASSRNRITPVGSQFLRAGTRAMRCVNVVGSSPRMMAVHGRALTQIDRKLLQSCAG